MNLADRLTWLRRLGVASIALTVLLMALGAWVKANGAGLSCPDWPQCYGEWMPPFPSRDNGGVWEGEAVGYSQAEILYEWTHRLVAAVTGFVVLAYAWVAVRGKDLAPATRRWPAAAFALVVFQAGLGAVTVKVGNKPWATTAHLVTAATFLIVLTVATCLAVLRPLPIDAPVEAPKPRKIEFVYPDAAPATPGAPGPASDHE